MSETERAADIVATAGALRRFTRDVFVRAGMSDVHAATVADVLVWADLRGKDSHGVTRIPRYLELIASGDLNPAPALATRAETVASVLIEADRAAGAVAMTAATSAAVSKARQAGVGLALVRRTTHTGALGYYTLTAADEGLAALALSASVPLMAYHGARAPGVGTSPISIGIPRGPDGTPMVLDMSTSAIPMGRLLQTRRSGEPIPAGTALDGSGNPTTDPRAAAVPLPVGGPKGSGLSLMIECIASLVAGNAILADALEGTAEGRRHRQNGLVLAIDLARFGDPDAYRFEVGRLVAALRRLPHAADVEILMPGERGHRTLELRTRRGIPLPASVVARLRTVADRLGVPMLPA